MAIQKINLGTEPLGEGGDTYRSANTKINENFSNEENAASRLVGLNTGNLTPVEDLYKATYSRYGITALTNVDLNDTKTLGRYSAVSSVKNTPGTGSWVLDNFASVGVNSSAISQMAYGRNGNQSVAYRQLSGNDWTPWATFYTTENTTKDSKTNLLLASGSELPEDSAASRRVGLGRNDLSTNNEAFEGIFRHYPLGSRTTGVWGDDIDEIAKIPAGYRGFGQGTRFTAESPTVAPFKTMKNSGWHYIESKKTYPTGDNRIIWVWDNTTGGLVTITKRTAGWSTWTEFYTDANTTKDTATGFLKVSSPVLHVYNDSITKIHEAEKLDITVDKKGVGHYEIHGTTGLRKNDGWFMSPPRDVHGNVLCMVDLEEKDGVVILKTYKKLFDFETVSIVHDYDNPMDIPEGVCVEFRFNDLPQEELDESEPVEEPIVEEEVESEVMEEPSEESE